ncbi:hypothetical protein PGT21_023359 [Puccinia graminis f. sp. tritici]|uniref:Uncharacterized protein n=1 Tax=Puccinia graminis f. sp. tritici TaxID=56615 RepID=A0A5B0LQT6_PUCGR|nr:hypothetical protein PGTUg99_018531 [Puccinia graminis f. sp. tritici]KAA1071937.1 hypothetical protein PGT21_023359 [Puccinia graminis f. sp. tritici]
MMVRGWRGEAIRETDPAKIVPPTVDRSPLQKDSDIRLPLALTNHKLQAKPGVYR